MDNQLPTFFGFSSLYLYFIIISVYLLLFRLKKVLFILNQPVAKIFILFFIICFITEVFHSEPRFYMYSRTMLMFIASIQVGALFDHKSSYPFIIYALGLSGILISNNIYGSIYSQLNSFSQQGLTIQEVDALRASLDVTELIKENLNRVANYLGLSGVISYFFATESKTKFKKYLFFSISIMSIFFAFMPMSRSAIFIIFATMFFVMFSFKMVKKSIIIFIIVGFILQTFIPSIIIDRFIGTTKLAAEAEVGLDLLDSKDSRFRMYGKVLKHFWEPMPFGVGEGNYWGDWGLNSSFAKGYRIGGTHNTFLQIYFQWGILPLFLFCLFMRKLYLIIMKNISLNNSSYGKIQLSFYLYAFFLLFFTHNIYLKLFSICFGINLGLSNKHNE